MFNNGLELLLLFSSSLFAATIFPAQSEIILAGLYANGEVDPIILLCVASIGNILGSCLNWILGVYITRLKSKKWLRLDSKNMERAQRFYNKYGLSTLLFSWVPIIGDPLTVLAGIFRVSFVPFLILVSIGKITRYIVILYFLGFDF